MGYDCTFHLIDESLVRDELVPALLGRRERPSDLEGRYDDAAGIWAKVHASLRDDSPEEAAQTVCQLAVMLASCRLPHGSLTSRSMRITASPPWRRAS